MFESKSTLSDLHWNDIQTVLLDMDGTLLDLHFDNYFWLEYLPEQFALKHRISVQNAKDELFPRLNAKQGTLQWYCIDYWSEQLNMDILALKTSIKHLIRERAGTLVFLQALRKARKQTILLTNAHHDTVTLKLASTQIKPYLDGCVTSHEIGLAKEHPDFWSQYTATKLTTPRDNCLFIDDNLAVLQSAKNFGIGYLFCIARPDSKRPPRKIDEFHALSSFEEIMPHNGLTIA